jgi:hypothetical protein
MELSTRQHSKTSQTARVLRLLKERGSVTNVEFNDMVCYRFSARIHELRNEGHEIISTREKGGVWRFTLKPEASA